MSEKELVLEGVDFNRFFEISGWKICFGGEQTREGYEMNEVEYSFLEARACQKIPYEREFNLNIYPVIKPKGNWIHVSRIEINTSNIMFVRIVSNLSYIMNMKLRTDILNEVSLEAKIHQFSLSDHDDRQEVNVLNPEFDLPNDEDERR